jgi:hypothetical protein
MPPLEPLHRWLADKRVGAPLLLCACAAMLAFGVVGIGRGGGFSQSNGDMQFLYVAGTCWLRGVSPYSLGLMDVARTIPGIELERLQVGFAYPPLVAPLSMLLAAMPLAAARVAMTLLNLGCVAALSWLCVTLSSQTYQTRPGQEPDPSLRWFVPVVVAGSPFTQHVLYMGQTSLLAITALLAGFWAVTQARREVLGGVLLAFSAIKPQVVVLPLLWLAFEKRWRVWGVIAVVTVFLCAYPISLSGPIGLAREWLTAINRYEHGPVQVAGFQHVFSLQSLLASSGLPAPSLVPLALAGFYILWWRRATVPEGDVPGLLTAVSFLFVYAHDYDLAALAPFLTMLWTRIRQRTGASVAYSAMVALLFVPQRALRGASTGVLLHWREIIVLAMLAWAMAPLEVERAPATSEAL